MRQALERKVVGKNIIYHVNPIYSIVSARYIEADSCYVLFQQDKTGHASIFGVVKEDNPREAERRIKKRAEDMLRKANRYPHLE